MNFNKEQPASSFLSLSDSQSGWCTFTRFPVIIMVQTLGGLGVDTGVTSLNLATA